MVDDNPAITTEQFAMDAMASHVTHNRVLGIVDYVELFKGDNWRESEEQRISNAVRNQRVVAWKTGSCEIALSQFSKTSIRGDLIGSLSEARYTGAYEQALDWGIILWNPKQMKERNIKFSLPDNKRDDIAYGFVQKNKRYPVGEFELEWYPEFSTFRDMALPMGQWTRRNKEDEW